MTKVRSTKSALIASVLVLVMCFTALAGTTFAWFTDSVTSSGNIIQTGRLEVTMEWLKGTEEPSENAAWIDASSGAIFNNTQWEPGYTEVRHIKIENVGTLALKYNVAIQANGAVSELSDVIDVYYVDPAMKIADGDELPEDKKIGTLTEVLANLNNTGAGTLEAGDKDVITLALKMRDTAGNEYQNLSIGSDFSIVLFATQDTFEEDSFDGNYDENAPKMFTVNGVAYDTAEEALLAANDGDKVVLGAANTPIVINKAIELTLANTNILAPAGVNAVTVNADATVIVEGNNVVTGGKGADGIYVSEGVTLTVKGSGNLVARGNAAAENLTEKVGGSGIGVDGTLVITALKNLSAEGWGYHGFGIGGSTDSILIENTTVNYVKGGAATTVIGTNYGKGDYEGGAAIGSSDVGAQITLKGATVHKAEGGSKSAAIGAIFHVGLKVDIIDSNVTAIGGSSSAAIGGSRLSKHVSDADQAIFVNIENSVVDATGGDFGAAIGSGYNTYCSASRAVTTVEIDAASNVTAQGGWLGAGVGTGHNAFDFVGKVECDTSNIKAGDSNDPSWCCWGNPTTVAQDVGQGVLSINNFKSVAILVTTEEQLLALGGTTVEGEIRLLADLDMTGYVMKPILVKSGSAINFLGNGNKISNLTLTSAGAYGMTGKGNEVAGLFDMTDNSGCELTVSDLTFENVTAVGENFGYAAAVVGYAQSSTDVITLNNVDVHGATVTADSVAALVGYTVAPISLTDCDVSGLTLTGEVGRPEKVGALVGTLNTATCNATAVNCTNATAYNDFGRIINGAKLNGAIYVKNTEQLKAAVEAGETSIFLADGEYTVPHVCQGKTLTISGSNGAVILVTPGGMGEAGGQLDYGFDGATVTFNGVTIKTNSQTYAGFARLSATYNGCVIQNTYNLGVGNSEFYNCIFNITNEYLRVGGAYSAVFDGCTFNTDGRAILVYQDGTQNNQTVTVRNCTFNATAQATTWNGIHVAAVSYDGSQGGTYTVNFEGSNTVDSDFNGLWQVKDGAANVTVNGLN